MSALGACNATAIATAPTGAEAAIAAADGNSANTGSTEAGDNTAGAGSNNATSFQRMMHQTQAAAPPQSDGAAPAAAAEQSGTALPSTDAATQSADDPWSQLLQLAVQAAGDADTAQAAASAAGVELPGASDRDADAAPQDDPLAEVLAALAQMGVNLQPVPLATAAPAQGVAAASVAVTAPLDNALAGLRNTQADAIAARLRPGQGSAPLTAANADSAADIGSSPGSLMAGAAAGNITLRDLLDGSGRDAASPGRDPVEIAAAARALESGVALSTVARDSSRAGEAVTRTISLPVQHPRWAEAVASDIRWFAEQGIQGATLRLTPEHLGPVEVRLSLTENQVTVNFSAPSAETRVALEQSLPRLREMLAGAGLSLGEAQVQQQTRQGSQNAFNSSGATADTDVRDTLARVPMRLGLVDEYA